MKIYKVEFSNEFDPEFDEFEDIIVASSPEEVAKAYAELFENQDRVERYNRKLTVTDVDRLIGTDGNYYNIVAMKL